MDCYGRAFGACPPLAELHCFAAANGGLCVFNVQRDPSMMPSTRDRSDCRAPLALNIVKLIRTNQYNATVRSSYVPQSGRKGT